MSSPDVATLVPPPSKISITRHRRARTRYQTATDDIYDCRRRDSENDRTDQQRSSDREKRLPLDVITQRKIPKSDSSREVTIHGPEANFVFPQVNRRHKGQDQIV